MTTLPDVTTSPASHAPGVIAALWATLRRDPLEAQAWLDLAKAYHAADLAPQQAYAASQLRRLQPRWLEPLANSSSDVAAEPWLRQPHTPPGQAWAERLQAWLQGCPGDWLSWLYLARLRDAAGPEQEPSTDRALQQAEALEPIAGESRHWLGLWRLHSGDPQGAIQALAPLVDRQPPRHGSMLYLGEALLRAGNRAAAEAAFTRASGSSNPSFLRLLAQRVYQHNYWQEAIAVLERALELAPDQLDTLLALARLHWEVYDLSAAETLCQRVLALDPGNGEVRYLLNALPGRRGDAAAHLAAVEAHYRELNDPGSRLASSVAMASLYVDDRTPEQVAELHRKLCEPIERRVIAQPPEAFANTLEPERPLHLGLVSGDFHRQHPVNLFMLPLLERLDRRHFPVTVFHTGTMHDEYTQRARQAASGWIEAAAMDDQGLQRRIQDERIDVLIDLAGHTSSHRLGVFAMRAAPVQATFLGYPHSTGLTRIDWLIGDPIVSPEQQAHLFSEGIAQLPASVFCWRPVDDYPLPPPRAPEAPLVFGSFNNIMKLSPATLALWARILRELPEAQLLLKAPSLGDASVMERFTGLFADHGIGAERLQFEGPSELGQMMQRYGAIDIALDPFPYNGGTTTLQALWMGVPVIARRGGNFVSSMGASFLTSLGRPDWIAADEDDACVIARRLAEQVIELRQGRAALRQQMANSPLADIERYVQDFQRLLRRMWRHHCQGEGTRLLPALAGDDA